MSLREFVREWLGIPAEERMSYDEAWDWIDRVFGELKDDHEGEQLVEVVIEMTHDSFGVDLSAGTPHWALRD